MAPRQRVYIGGRYGCARIEKEVGEELVCVFQTRSENELDGASNASAAKTIRRNSKHCSEIGPSAVREVS